MFLNINKIKNETLKWLLYIVAIFFITGIILTASALIFEKIYENKIYPRINLGDINLTGLTAEEAQGLVKQKIEEIDKNGIIFEHNKKEISVIPTISSFNADLAYQIMDFDVEKTIEQALNYGRNNNFFTNLQNKLKVLIFKKPVALVYDINEEEIEKILKENFKEFENPAQDASLTATSTAPENGQKKIIFNIEEEKIGKIIDYQKGIEEFKKNLANFDTRPIHLYSKTDYPKIYQNECLNIEIKAQKIINAAPLILQSEGKKWIIKAEQLAGWLALERKNPADQDKRHDTNEIIVSLNKEKTIEFLEQTIGSIINEEPINARFEMDQGRVVKFQGSRDGLKLNSEASFNKIKSDFILKESDPLLGGTSTIELIAKIIESEVETGDVNDLGIKEIIGTGHSNFAGSPANRRHNIKVGAASINGLLIKPNEEFSLVKALGKVSAASGYLPELVIKGNETIPEYGGGLCQIGTTMFRTAIASGLPITARRNHSYRVSYYEPAGTDAAVYDPRPDVRFINDTGNNILIQVRFNSNDLYFDFWGAKDGRIIEITDPIIYNISRPGPTKIIETLDLPLGEKKCTEHAHNGADTYFDYKITYPQATSTEQIIKERRFTSHYIPWQEVCLVGVEKLSEEEDNNKNNSENITEESKN